MTTPYRKINIFVSHPFEPANPEYDLEKFRTNITLIVREAESIVRKEFKEFEIETVFQFSDFQQSLPHQIESNIRKCHFAIVDITENKPNIFFEYGLMRGINIPVLLTKTKASFNNFDIPADIKDQNVISFDNFEELRKKCVPNIVFFFKQLLTGDSLYNVYLNKVWFPSNVSTINVITSSEAEKREFASPESDNYMFLESLGDKDSLLEVMVFLSRTYRNVKITMCSADEFRGHIEDNLVVIGGPGDEDGDANAICRLMMEKMPFKVSYSDDLEALVCKGNEYRAKKRGNKTIKDYGYFARFPNPFNQQNSVILLHGIHTFGVLGAAKAFSDHPMAQGNIKKLMNKLNLDDVKQEAFECFFPVDVLQQTVVCPDIEEDNILTLKQLL